ncbi:hypothetical protein BDW22DRAFT_1044359 [Trametopsis cervina]|nr:hypothetical protein BDW22DRAFT_1044359 [Trametopsis cervina]
MIHMGGTARVSRTLRSSQNRTSAPAEHPHWERWCLPESQLRLSFSDGSHWCSAKGERPFMRGCLLEPPLTIAALANSLSLSLSHLDMHFTLLTVLLPLFLLVQLVYGASLRVRSPYCCTGKTQTSSLPAQSPLRSHYLQSASWSWVGFGCTALSSDWEDAHSTCYAIPMFCTNTLKGSFGGTALNCVLLG